MPLGQLRALSAAARTITDVGLGLINQPKFNVNDTGRCNQAGEALDAILDWLTELNEAIHNVAVAAKPVTPDEVEHRFWTTLQYEIHCGESIATMCALTGNAALAYQEAEQAQARAAYERRQPA